MRSPKPYACRLSSKPCSTCEDLRRLKARSGAALRNARNLYRAAVEAIDPVGLQNLEEEWKQTSAARRLICYSIQAHPVSTLRRAVSAWPRDCPRKES